ncbi:hypothetical protein Tco_0201707 [Tanacetum coccineum]
MLDSDFIPSDDSLGSDLEDTFSISFIRNLLCPVIETLLPISSNNEVKVFNPGILISKDEKSSHLLSHRRFKVFQLIFLSADDDFGKGFPFLEVTDISQKDKKRSKTDKTEHGNGKSVIRRSQSYNIGGFDVEGNQGSRSLDLWRFGLKMNENIRWSEHLNSRSFAHGYK